MTIWGNKEPKYILAHYKTEDNKSHQSLLLCDGYWKLARHFHYIPEWFACFFGVCLVDLV